MSFKENLENFRREINKEIEKYLDKVINESKKQDPFIANSLRNVKKLILSGGKRLRSSLMYYGYLAAGGKEKEKILKTSVSIELIHIFLLIHDDIIDRDLKRHGIDTIHNTYSKFGKIFFPKSDFRHFGNSIAIIVGDMAGALGNQIIFNSDFDPALVMKALSKLQSIVSMTCIGETQDIYIEYKGKATEKEIMRMYENKTAKYTMEGPLHLGAILGGADKKILSGFSRFSIPVGVAFQIQDDILGIFGSENKMGKTVGADIKEGKQTILIAKAREKADKEQKKYLSRILGNKNANREEIEKIRKIIIETGSLEYARKLSLKLINEGKKELEKMEIRKEAKDFLGGIADYMIEREL